MNIKEIKDNMYKLASLRGEKWEIDCSKFRWLKKDDSSQKRLSRLERIIKSERQSFMSGRRRYLTNLHKLKHASQTCREVELIWKIGYRLLKKVENKESKIYNIRADASEFLRQAIKSEITEAKQFRRFSIAYLAKKARTYSKNVGYRPAIIYNLNLLLIHYIMTSRYDKSTFEQLEFNFFNRLHLDQVPSGKILVETCAGHKLISTDEYFNLYAS